MHVLVLSDTHAPRFWKALPPALIEPLRQADLVLHAGDVCTPDVLDTLAEHVPVRVVLGNNDGPPVGGWGGGVPETLELEIEGVRLAMIHDSGPRTGRDRRMRRRFTDADLVVFGHSQVPLDEPDDPRRKLNVAIALLTPAHRPTNAANPTAPTPAHPDRRPRRRPRHRSAAPLTQPQPVTQTRA